MPNLPPTPWLRAPDPGATYLKGLAIGNQQRNEAAQIGLAQQRIAQQAAESSAQLQQRSQIAQMEMEMRQKEHERQSLMEQQKMEIDKQYHQMQMSLGQEKIKEAHALNQEKIKKTADVAAAKMSYQKAIEGIDMDTSLDQEQRQQLKYEAMMQYGPGMVEDSGVGTVLGALNKFQPAPMPRLDQKTGALIDIRGVPHWTPREGQTQDQRTDYQWLKIQAEPLTKALAKAYEDRNAAEAAGNNRGVAALDKTIQGLKSEIEKLNPRYSPAPQTNTGSIKIIRDPKTGRLVVSGGVSASDEEPEDPVFGKLEPPLAYYPEGARPLTMEDFPPPPPD